MGERYSESRAVFSRALTIAPDNQGAAKGLAYTYLWEGNTQRAAEDFAQLEKRWPNDPEIAVALGQAELAQDDVGKASNAFTRAQAIDPAREDAAQGLASIRQYPALAELSFWVGNTSGEDETGLREVELASWINRKTRVWARYDNALSFDNPTLARAGVDAEAYFIGALRQFNDQWLGSLELGQRDLPNDKEQQIIKAEGVHFLRGNGAAIKLGVQVSPHEDDFTDKLVYASYNFPIGDRWRLEPAFFFSRSGGFDDDEWRAAMSADYRASNGWTWTLGGGAGRVDSVLPQATGTVSTVNGRVSVPIFDNHEFKVSVRYENAPLNDFTVVMGGLTLRLPRR